MNYKLFCVLILMLSANFFYECSLLGEDFEPIYKFVFYAVFMLVALISYLKNRNRKKSHHAKEQKVLDNCIFLLLFGLLLSFLNSSLFKGQSLKISIMTNIPMMIAYSSYFVFKRMNLTNIDERVIISFMAIIYCIVFVFSFVTLPNPLFGSFAYEELRGGFRLRIRGLFWVSLLFFYLLQRYKELKKMPFLIGALGLSLFIVASLARQYILWTALLGTMMLMMSTKWIYKFFLILIIALIGFFVIPKIPLVNNLKELSEMQIEQNEYGEDDRRVKDYQTFLFKYDRNVSQYVFGCGLGSQGNSKYGDELEHMKESEGLIPEDAGWAGSVFLYGYFSTFVLLFLFLYCILNTKNNYFRRFYMAYIALCAIGGGTILYFHEVMITMFVLSNSFRINQLPRLDFGATKGSAS